MNDQTIISRNEKAFMVSELGKEMVMMNTDTGDYLGLNKVSTKIWKLLENPITPQQIIDELLLVFTVSKEDCEKETMTFLSKMENYQMLVYHQLQK